MNTTTKSKRGNQEVFAYRELKLYPLHSGGTELNKALNKSFSLLVT